jgi:hypothetical protein
MTRNSSDYSFCKTEAEAHPERGAAQQIKDSCRACILAAAKSVVELNPKTHFQVWIFNAGEKASGAEGSGVVWSWASSRQSIVAVKRRDGSLARQSFSEDQGGGHTPAMAHSEVSAESVKVA